MAKEAYKDHMPGSRKGKVHKAYDEGGAKKAMKIGLALGMNKRTIQNNISEFGGVGTTKAATKKTVKKTAKVAPKPAKKSVKKTVKAPAKKTVKKVVKKATKKVAKEPKSTIVTDVVTHG